MSTPSFLPIADQVAEHLHAEILRERWSGTLPGKHQLAIDLGANNKTVEAALRQLEKTGLLLPQGAGRNRLINPRRRKSSRALRIALLLNELAHDEKSELHLEITHALTDAGHATIIAPRSLDALRFDPKRMAKLVRETKTDACHLRWLAQCARMVRRPARASICAVRPPHRHQNSRRLSAQTPGGPRRERFEDWHESA